MVTALQNLIIAHEVDLFLFSSLAFFLCSENKVEIRVSFDIYKL